MHFTLIKLFIYSRIAVSFLARVRRRIIKARPIQSMQRQDVLRKGVCHRRGRDVTSRSVRVRVALAKIPAPPRPPDASSPLIQ